MQKSVNEFEDRTGYAFDTDWHTWEEVCNMYPDCYLLVVDVKEEYSGQYPPLGFRVFGWNKDKNFDLGDVDTIENDVAMYHRMYDTIKHKYLMNFCTKWQTFREYTKNEMMGDLSTHEIYSLFFKSG